jgi:hypothetical protein
MRFYSSSKQLAEQMQIIGLKIGKISTLSNRFRQNVTFIKNREIKHKEISYEVTFSDRKRLWVDTKKIKKVKYNGKVYCCSVPNKIIYVRRNKFSVWCGNSVPTHVDFTYNLLHLLDNEPNHSEEYDDFKMITTIVWDKNQIGGATSWGSWKSPSQPSFPTQFEFVIVVGKGTKMDNYS